MSVEPKTVGETLPAKLDPWPGEGGDFAFGGDVWPGLGKLIEEMNEVGLIAGKIIAFPGRIDHPDGTENVPFELQKELADLSAVIQFLVERNGLDAEFIERRKQYKLERFNHWHDVIREELSE